MRFQIKTGSKDERKFVFLTTKFDHYNDVGQRQIIGIVIFEDKMETDETDLVVLTEQEFNALETQWVVLEMDKKDEEVGETEQS